MEHMTIKEETKLRPAMPLLNTPYPLGGALAAVEQIEDEDTRNIALAEYYYFRGQSVKASELTEPYLTHPDLALRFSACWIYGYANLARNRIPQTRQALHQVWATVKMLETADATGFSGTAGSAGAAGSQDSSASHTPEIYRAYGVCMGAFASVLLHLPLSQTPSSPIKPYIPMLSPGLRLFAFYVQAHQAYLDGEYGTCIGIAETALSLEDPLYQIPSIYLHLAATMGYVNLKKPEQAKQHLLEAWEIARPDDMIEAFGEHHGLLGGMLEAVIKKEYPEDFNRIIDITYSFSAGWRKIHNPDTSHPVADDLTTTEFAIAMLAARGWSNKEISAHLDISTNTVKMHISSALKKLGISQRKDLSQFMLK